MKKQQYIVFGLNRFGTSVARTLAAAGNEVVAVDQDADRVAQIADDVSYAVQVDVAAVLEWSIWMVQSLLLLATWKQAL